jgi:hypothetical protein
MKMLRGGDKEKDKLLKENILKETSLSFDGFDNDFQVC